MQVYTMIRTALLAGATCLPFSSVQAEGNFHADPAHQMTAIITDTGVANRLAVGEVLRSLTQEIPAAACHLHHGVNVADAADVLSDGIAQTTELLAALQQGDIFWGIEFAETRRKTIAEIGSLRDSWTPVQAAAVRLLDDPTRAADVSDIIHAADRLYDQTYGLLTTLDSQYSGSAEILSRDVMFIQISGRMTALNQRMALQACQLSSGDWEANGADALKQSMQDYQGSLHALSEGLPAMGILPPQTPGIADKLGEIAELWSVNSPLLALVAANEPLSEQQRFDLYYQLIDERVVLLDLVYLYQDHSKIMH